MGWFSVILLRISGLQSKEFREFVITPILNASYKYFVILYFKQKIENILCIKSFLIKFVRDIRENIFLLFLNTNIVVFYVKIS